MTPTLMLMCFLLGKFLVFSTAHAEDFPQKIQLHNESVLVPLSAVSNWTLLCEHLCSLNISGPACGPDCVQTVSERYVNKELQMLDKENVNHHEELCETLCDNGVGGNRCTCPISVVPAASSMPSPFEKNKFCSDFCRFQHVTLRGCKRCPYDNFPKKPVKNSVKPTPTPQHSLFAAPFQPHRFDSEQEIPSRTFENSADASSATPTTPDWNRLCANLCRQGTGGILCNCDLAPF